MEKEKKVSKKTVPVKSAKVEGNKATKTTAKKSTPAKVEKVEVVETNQGPIDAKVTEQPKTVKKPVTLNQELNLMVGLFTLMTIVAFCFAFQDGEVELLGWELFLKSGEYSGVFKGLMIVYAISIFVDCVLAIRIDCENEIFNIVEKVLYMFTLVINIIVVAVLLSLISKIGIGLIIFLIISILSVIVKLARIYSQNK